MYIICEESEISKISVRCMCACMQCSQILYVTIMKAEKIFWPRLVTLYNSITALFFVVFTKYYFVIKSRRLDMGRTCSTHEKNEYKILVSNSVMEATNWVTYT